MKHFRPLFNYPLSIVWKPIPKFQFSSVGSFNIDHSTIYIHKTFKHASTSGSPANTLSVALPPLNPLIYLINAIRLIEENCCTKMFSSVFSCLDRWLQLDFLRKLLPSQTIQNLQICARLYGRKIKCHELNQSIYGKTS